MVKTTIPLTELDLSSNNIVDEKAANIVGDVIASSNTLHTIHLRDNKIGSKNALAILKALKENLGFKVLDVSSCDLKDLFCFPMTLVIASHPVLQELDLSGNGITDEGVIKLLEGIKRTKSLTKLNLMGNKVKSHSIKPLLDTIAQTGFPTS